MFALYNLETCCEARSALLNTLRTGDFQKAMEEIVEKRQTQVGSLSRMIPYSSTTKAVKFSLVCTDRFVPCTTVTTSILALEKRVLRHITSPAAGTGDRHHLRQSLALRTVGSRQSMSKKSWRHMVLQFTTVYLL